MLGTGDLSELALGLVDIRRRRPDVALQRQRRRAKDTDPAPDPLGHRLASVRRRGQRGAAVGPGHRDHSRAGPDGRRRGRSRAARPRSARMCCRTFRCSRCCGTGSGRPRWHSWPGTRGATPERGDWPAGFPETRTTGILTEGDPALAAGVRAAVLLVQPSSSARRCRTGPRCRTAGRFRRAATGGRRRTCRPAPGSTRSNAKSPRTNAFSRRSPGRTRPGEYSDGRPPPLIGHRCHGDADDQTDDQWQPEPANLLLVFICLRAI